MYSEEHKNYLKKNKRKKYIILFFQILIISLIIGLWQLLADYNIINTFLSSSPKGIFNTLISLYESNNLFNHIFVTIYEIVISLLLGTLIGFVISSLLWWNDYIAKIFDPYLTIFNSLPKVALGPIIIIIAGANRNSIILMALLISVIITIINMYQSFILTDDNKIKLLKSFNASKKQIYRYLILPSSFSNIISTIKINISMSLVGLLPPVGEKIIF